METTRTLSLDQLAGARITEARTLNRAELLWEGNGAYAGAVLSLSNGDAIVIVSKTLDDDEYPSDECWTEARWQTIGGESLDLTS